MLTRQCSRVGFCKSSGRTPAARLHGRSCFCGSCSRSALCAPGLASTGPGVLLRYRSSLVQFIVWCHLVVQLTFEKGTHARVVKGSGSLASSCVYVFKRGLHGNHERPKVAKAEFTRHLKALGCVPCY